MAGSQGEDQGSQAAPTAPTSGDRHEGRSSGASTDEDLLAGVACGDQRCFGELYDRTAGVVYGVIHRVLRDPAQSEEVAQEVLIEVWRTATRFDVGRGRARSWMLTMAHRRAIDRVRSEQRSRDRIDRFGADQASPAFNEVTEQAEVSAEHAQVRELLSELTDLQREAVELAYFQGYTYRQVAELLETPLGTIKSRIRDGILQLRDAMGVSA